MLRLIRLTYSAVVGSLILGALFFTITLTPTESVSATTPENASPVVFTQECAKCEAVCKSWVDKCKEGGQRACYKAAACLCKCNYDAGGCGSSKDALKQCYEQNEKSAKELESPPVQE